MADYSDTEASDDFYVPNADPEDVSSDAGQQVSDRHSEVTSDFGEIGGCFTSSSLLHQQSRMVNNPFAAVKVDTPTRSMADSTENKESRPILAPPTLILDRGSAEADDVTSTFRLKPPILNNPFMKVDVAASAKRNDTSDTLTTEELGAEECLTERRPALSANVANDGGDEKSTTLASPPANGCRTGSAQPETTNTFHVQPLSRPTLTTAVDFASFASAASVAAVTPIPLTLPVLPQSQSPGNTFMNSRAVNSNAKNSGSAFVFGQNMDERVTNVKSPSFGTLNGATDLTFGPDVGSSADGQKTTASASNYAELEASGWAEADDDNRIKSLTESALEYESRKVKRTYDEVAIVTGEEDESNVLQLNCKLFAFDSVTSSWIERGRGLLRLNDKELDNGVIQSRIVARTQGSLRVVLNTKVWPGMSVDRPSPNSVRLTAMDGDTAKIFLIKAGPKDCDQLFGALDWRVTTLKSSEDRRSNNEPSWCSSELSTSSVLHSHQGVLTCSIGDDATISSSSSATSPSLSPCSAASPSTSGTSSSTVIAVAASSVATTASEGNKKRRISPPSASEESNEIEASSTDVQERRVDSTDCRCLDLEHHQSCQSDCNDQIFATFSQHEPRDLWPVGQ